MLMFRPTPWDQKKIINIYIRFPVIITTTNKKEFLPQHYI